METTRHWAADRRTRILGTGSTFSAKVWLGPGGKNAQPHPGDDPTSRANERLPSSHQAAGLQPHAPTPQPRNIALASAGASPRGPRRPRLAKRAIAPSRPTRGAHLHWPAAAEGGDSRGRGGPSPQSPAPGPPARRRLRAAGGSPWRVAEPSSRGGYFGDSGSRARRPPRPAGDAGQGSCRRILRGGEARGSTSGRSARAGRVTRVRGKDARPSLRGRAARKCPRRARAAHLWPSG